MCIRDEVVVAIWYYHKVSYHKPTALDKIGGSNARELSVTSLRA